MTTYAALQPIWKVTFNYKPDNNASSMRFVDIYVAACPALDKEAWIQDFMKVLQSSPKVSPDSVSVSMYFG